MQLIVLLAATAVAVLIPLALGFPGRSPPICPPHEHVCPLTIYRDNLTDAVCYRHGPQICRDGLLCLPHEYRCGDACYDPNANVCIEDFFICPLWRSSLCGMSCYDPHTLTCIDGRLYMP